MATVREVHQKYRPEAYSADRRPSAAEVWWWLFMRVSGVVLLFLVLAHLFIMHIQDAGVERVNFDFVAQRWASVGWKTFDWLMLFLATLHGTNGVRVIINDYMHSSGLRTFVKLVLYTLAAALLVMGTAVLVTFEG